MSEALVRDLETLAELFKSGGFSELRVESASLSVLFSTDAASAATGTPAAVPMPAAAPIKAAAVPAAPARAASSGPVDPSWSPVVAPNLGTFYRSPKPGAPAFVEVGDRVEADTEICLLEVMKLFTSVKAGVAGTVRSISAADAELVEGGQTLFYIETD